MKKLLASASRATVSSNFRTGGRAVLVVVAEQLAALLLGTVGAGAAAGAAAGAVE